MGQHLFDVLDLYAAVAQRGDFRADPNCRRRSRSCRLFTNSAGMFGDSEIQSVGVVSFADNKIVRWADYWDARHFGIANFEALRTPDAQYPADFRETLALESTEPAFANLVA